MTQSDNLFFCISHYTGDYSWISTLNPKDCVVYNKSKSTLPEISEIGISIQNIPNVGYNIYSYLLFICSNYYNLPKRIVFCKSNVFPRHVSRETFDLLLQRPDLLVFIDEAYKLMNISDIVLRSNSSFIEFNDSWYSYQYPRLYFKNFFEYYDWFFQTDRVSLPLFLAFSPGANYIVDRSLILSRSLTFYQSLIQCVEHSQFSGESHFVERSLPIIWNPIVPTRSIFESHKHLPSILNVNGLSTKPLSILSYIYLYMFKMIKVLVYSFLRTSLSLYIFTLRYWGP